jgi:hypothetical protein
VIALLNLAEHLVEPIDQHAQLVIGGLVRADAIVAQHGDRLGGLHQVDHRVADETLQTVAH